MNEDLLIIVALVAAAAAFVGILIFFSVRLLKAVTTISKAEKQVEEKILVVNRSSVISNVKTIEFD